MFISGKDYLITGYKKSHGSLTAVAVVLLTDFTLDYLLGR